MPVSIVAPSYDPHTAGKWVKRGTAVLLAGAIFLSAPASVRSMGSSSVGAGPQSVSAVAASPSSVLQHAGPAAGTGVPVTAGVLESEVQKRLNIRPLMDWIWNNARWLWNQLANAAAWGWNAFINWWNGLAGWIRTTINFFISGALWDAFVEIRRYFGWW